MDYFEEIYEYVKSNFNVRCYQTRKCELTVQDIQGFKVNDKVKALYQTYDQFELSWANGEKYVGSIRFVPYKEIENKHKELIEIFNECSEWMDNPDSVKDDIYNWYPVFEFPNGDAFCLDIRDGSVKFYEHDFFDGGPYILGTKLANSLDELLLNWSRIHFADVYDWDKVVSETGLDLNNEYLLSWLRSLGVEKAM